MSAADKLAERFWSKVNFLAPGGCWEWQASRSPAGYGQFMLRDPRSGKWRPHPAHRVAYSFEHGMPDASVFLCHRCDNTRCVRPEHLFPGDAAANARDMVAKGRHFSPFRAHVGAAHPGAVTAAQAAKVQRLLRTTQLKQREIAKRCGVSHWTCRGGA